jgi:predicted RNase H-like HicB family nuclease
MKNYQVIETPSGNTIIQYEENGFLVSIPQDPGGTFDGDSYSLVW